MGDDFLSEKLELFTGMELMNRLGSCITLGSFVDAQVAVMVWGNCLSDVVGGGFLASPDDMLRPCCNIKVVSSTAILTVGGGFKVEDGRRGNLEL